MGRKKKPFYRIVVTDSRSPRDGKYIECVGTYNSLTNPPNIEIKEERINYWLDQGVIPSDTVGSLLRQKGLILKRHLKKSKFDDSLIEEELKKWEVLQIDRQRRKEGRTCPGKEEGKEKGCRKDRRKSRGITAGGSRKNNIRRGRSGRGKT
jgi:small subunit ribosomal protein S16